MRELSLFTGAGGGLLGTKLLGWTHIGYVEINEYCQRIIAQRIKDGMLDNAPIFTDLRSFIDTGCCELYRGITDVISAGFPCQPYSVAGQRKAENDDRNLWPETKTVIREIGPATILLENVPGLLSFEYAVTIINELAEIGYEVLPPLILGADDLKAPHRRKRLWIVAYAMRCGCRETRQRRSICQDKQHGQAKVSDTGHELPQIRGKRNGNRRRGAVKQSPGSPWREWPAEPGLGRVAHGVANRVDRLKAIGNGQVPRVVAAAWRILTEEI